MDPGLSLFNSGKDEKFESGIILNLENILE